MALAAVLLLLLPGCGDDTASAPSVWGGSVKVSADRAELRNIRWEKIPGWDEWAALPQKNRITIQGEWKIAGSADSVRFQCRLTRQSGSLYKVSFNTENAGKVFSVAGDLDWVQRSAALDFHGRFSPEQYRTYLGRMPELKQGFADVSGSVLQSDGKTSFPVLTVVPEKNSILQFGSLPMKGGRMDCRETFSGKLEFTFSGVTIQAGGITLYPGELTIDQEHAVFKTAVEPDMPWQASVPLQGEGRCSLAKNGEWSLVAELPEAGVFRKGDLILPLRSCRIRGTGNAEGGKWTFHGEGASGSLLQKSGTVTAANVQINGEKMFRFQDGNAAFIPESLTVECGNLEIPCRYGRVAISRYKGECRLLPSGGWLYSGSAGVAALMRKGGGGLRLEEPVWEMPLWIAGDRIFSAEPGSFRAGKLLLTGEQGQIAAVTVKSSITLKEHSWKMGMFAEEMKIVSGKITGALGEADLTISGSRDGAGWIEIAGQGKTANIQTVFLTGDCGSWELHLGLSPDFARSNLLSWSGKNWKGKLGSSGAWNAGNFSIQADRSTKNLWRGSVSLKKAELILPDWEVRGVSLQLPFGGAEVEKSKIFAERIRYKAMTVSGVSVDLKNTADGVSLRGRGRSELTGGACFVTGDVRKDLQYGIVEYSMPSATLEKELKIADLLPLSGGWIFSGKMGSSGKILWENSVPRWQGKYNFSGFARNADCMVEELSGQIEPGGENIADAQLLFRRLTSVSGECSDGELQFRTEKQQMILKNARWDAWGGHWKYLRDGEFQVKGVQLAGLLPISGWQDAVHGKFSGTVSLNEAFQVEKGDLKSDGAGSLALAGMEKYRLLPKKEFDMNALAFTTAAFREFQFNTLALRLIRRKNGVLLRISGEGRPAKAVPFVLEKSGLFRPAISGERGFDGNVEIGCGYRIPLRNLVPEKNHK